MYYKRRLKYCLYIPLEIQLEIIKRIPDVKSLLRFRSVSKRWKSFIDSSEFVAFYEVRHTQQPHRLLFFYTNALDPYEENYTCFVDDDNDTFTHQQDCASTLSTITKQHTDLWVIGCTRGLLCLHCSSISCDEEKVVLWNPCITKSVVISVPFADENIRIAYGFGVCPVTNDPTIVRIQYTNPHSRYYNLLNKPWHVEVFTLSTGVWNALPCSNIPHKLCKHDLSQVIIKKFQSSQVVINRFIYWVVKVLIDMGEFGSCDKFMILSFDLIAKEFRASDFLPCAVEEENIFFISNLKQSLVLFEPGIDACDVHKMEPDGSFTKLFIINRPDVVDIYGFRKNGELVMETSKEDGEFAALKIYDPCKERISNLGIYGNCGSFFMSSYKETLLLLDHSDSCVY